MADPVKQLTRKSIFGRWNFRSEEKNIYVDIDEDEGRILFCDEDDHVISEDYFSPESHWENDYLCYEGAGEKYFTGYANRSKMSFGEFSTPGVAGNVKWMHVFSRIDG